MNKISRTTRLIVLTAGLGAAFHVTAGPVENLTTFTANTPARAAEVNGNFSAVKTAVDDNYADLVALVARFEQRFHGDGSAGDLLVNDLVSWASPTAAPENYHFGNVTIEAGGRLEVPAGTIIRCSGTFTNFGTLHVLRGARSTGVRSFTSSDAVHSNGMYAIGHPGDTPAAAGGGSYHDGATIGTEMRGGYPGTSIPIAVARSAFHQFRLGGGSGVSPGESIFEPTGGGLVRIQCRGAIVNAGTIVADGLTNTWGISSGGGGGIVILASSTSIESSGTIQARGGAGNPAKTTGDTYVGAGGGGGGGIVILAAPAVAPGTIDVQAGTAGATAEVSTLSRRFAGSGGGGSGGPGGVGGGIDDSGGVAIARPAASGTDGYSLILQRDPALLLQ